MAVMVVSDRASHERARYVGELSPTRSLDRLAELAAHLLRAQSAQVSIISDVQSVIGAAGASVASLGKETPAEESLCTVTADAGEPLAVEDAPQDPRVAHLPPVTSGDVGAYLGVPLVDARGRTLGALCVFDDTARSWSPADITILEQLAAPVLAELELSALTQTYESEQLVWEIAVDAGGIGAFDWDLVTGELRWDQRLLDLFGLDDDSWGGTIEAFNATVHPDDVGAVSLALSTAIADCATFDVEYRVLRPDGRTTWITGRGRALPGTDGTAVRVLGAAYDTSEKRERDASGARFLEAMPLAFFHLDADWRFAYANAGACTLLGFSRDALLGADVWELFPEAVGSDFETHYRRAVETGESVGFDAYYPAPLDTWFEVRAWPSPDGLSVFFNDVTARLRAHEVLEESARRTAVVSAIASALTGTLDPVVAVDHVASAVVPTLAEWCVVSLVERDVHPDWRRRTRDVAGVHADPARQALVTEYLDARIPALTDDAFLVRALTAGEVVTMESDATASILSVMAPDSRAAELCRELAPESALILPLRAGDRTVGMLSLYRGADRPPFSLGDRETVTEISARAGLALDNARLYSEQRELAEGLQRSMMTAPPEPDHLEIAVRYLPAAEAAQVGGDWYDAFLQADGNTVLAIGDVMGHDTAAAAGMGQVRGLLRGIAVHSGAGPAEVLSGTDGVMRILQVGVTATAVVARLEQDHVGTQTWLRWSNAGHLPPLVVSPTGAITELSSTPELLLGLEPSTDRTDHVTPIERGSTVLLYTDGLVERRGESLDDGLALLHSTLTELAATDLTLDELLDRLLTRMLPARREDDVAVTAVRLHPQDEPRPPEAGPSRIPPGVPEES